MARAIAARAAAAMVAAAAAAVRAAEIKDEARTASDHRQDEDRDTGERCDCGSCSEL